MTAAEERNVYYTTSAIVTGIVLIYVILSADCATGGSCTFANGDLANWLFSKLQSLEWAFWHIVPG